MPLTVEQRDAILRAVVEDRFDNFLVLRLPAKEGPARLKGKGAVARRTLRASSSETWRLLTLLADAASSAVRATRRPALCLLMGATLRDLLDRIVPMIEIFEESDRRVFSAAALKGRDEALLRWWADAAEVIDIDREAWETVRRDMDVAQSAHITREFVKAFPEIEIGWCVDDHR